MKECINCGAMNEEEVIFCATCGHEYPDSDRAATEDTTPHELSSLSGEKLIVPIKEVLCPHCNFHVEINLAHRYQCPNCNRFFSHSKSFFYRCDVCATPVIIHTTSNFISCSVCTQKYRFDVKNITLANPLAELKPEQKEPAKLSFGFIFLLGFVTLIISLLSFIVVNTEYNAIMSSQIVNNFFILALVSLILFIVVYAAIHFFVLDHTLIATEGMSIVVIDLLLVIFTIFIHENPEEFSSLLPILLIGLYIMWIIVRTVLYIFSPASGQAATNDWFFWFCVCDSTNECFLPCLGECDCGNCDCGDCDI